MAVSEARPLRACAGVNLQYRALGGWLCGRRVEPILEVFRFQLWCYCFVALTAACLKASGHKYLSTPLLFLLPSIL